LRGGGDFVSAQDARREAVAACPAAGRGSGLPSDAPAISVMAINCKYRHRRYTANIAPTDIHAMQPITNPAQIGGLLLGRRKHLKLSQAEVAEKLGLSQSRLSELEASPETLTVAQLLVLMRVLGLQLTVGDRAPARKPKTEW
jgi:HTH-type transcriptional regulator / antitoxin HipB